MEAKGIHEYIFDLMDRRWVEPELRRFIFSIPRRSSQQAPVVSIKEQFPPIGNSEFECTIIISDPGQPTILAIMNNDYSFFRHCLSGEPLDNSKIPIAITSQSRGATTILTIAHNCFSKTGTIRAVAIPPHVEPIIHGICHAYGANVTSISSKNGMIDFMIAPVRAANHGVFECNPIQCIDLCPLSRTPAAIRNFGPYIPYLWKYPTIVRASQVPSHPPMPRGAIEVEIPATPATSPEMIPRNGETLHFANSECARQRISIRRIARNVFASVAGRYDDSRKDKAHIIAGRAATPSFRAPEIGRQSVPLPTSVPDAARPTMTPPATWQSAATVSPTPLCAPVMAEVSPFLASGLIPRVVRQYVIAPRPIHANSVPVLQRDACTSPINGDDQNSPPCSTDGTSDGTRQSAGPLAPQPLWGDPSSPILPMLDPRFVSEPLWQRVALRSFAMCPPCYAFPEH